MVDTVAELFVATLSPLVLVTLAVFTTVPNSAVRILNEIVIVAVSLTVIAPRLH